MALIRSDKNIAIWILAAVAALFGLLTVLSGGQVLFGGNSSREAAGNYVSFVVWFNFLAGFAYLAAGAGIWLRQRWSVWFSLLIAITTIIVFGIFGLHILKGGVFENRTIGAMGLRSLVWISIFVFSYKTIIQRQAYAKKLS
jgi:hypothetical protein